MLREWVSFHRGNILLFCMVCKLAAGKIVIFPGVSVVFTTRAPFSSSIHVEVSPSIDTTRLVAPVWGVSLGARMDRKWMEGWGEDARGW